MKEVTVKVYTYDELSDKAKERAHADWLRNDYYDGSDNANTLSAFEKIFPVKIKNWEYGYRNYINWSFTGDDDIEELKGVRLLAYLWNNYHTYLFKGKYYYRKSKSRRSKVLLENCCVLTGYCLDDDILKPIYDFMAKPDKYSTFHSLMNDCLNAWLSACEKDYEYQCSEAYFKETCEVNEYTFLNNGKMVNSQFNRYQAG